MKALHILLSLTLVAVIALPAAATHDDVAVDREATLETLEALVDELDEIERQNERNPNRVARERVYDSLKRMRRDVRRLRREVRDAPIVESVPPPVIPPIDPPVEVIEPINSSDFQKLMRAIKDASFSKQKIGLVQDATKFHFFTTNQVIQVMEEMSFDKDKVEVAAIMHPRLVDPDQFFQVYSHLSFDSEKEKLRNRVAR